MKKVFVAATRQNDGKTIASIGLIAAMKNRLGNVGYIKPVGQHYVEVGDHKVDEDAILVQETYHLDCELQDMSPVAVPRGFTEAYIANPDRGKLASDITEAYSRVSRGKEFTLIEGTGHAGVGSVFDMSNADVAELLGSKVFLVSSGGVGKPIDEIMLNKALFDKRGVEILGVIVNKVQQDKYEKIAPIVTRGLQRLGVNVLGVLPHTPALSNPTVAELLDDIKGEVLGGEQNLGNVVSRMIVGAMPPHEALDYMGPGVLLITPGTREELILAAMSSCLIGQCGEQSVAGIILTGGVKPHSKIMHLFDKTCVPIISVPDDTFKTATRINNLIVKVRPGDTNKIQASEQLVRDYVDLDRMMSMLGE